MCKQQRMTLKNFQIYTRNGFKFDIQLVLDQKLTRDKELGTESENK